MGELTRSDVRGEVDAARYRRQHRVPKRGKKKTGTHFLRNTSPTSHSFAPPTEPDEMPETQVPWRSAVSGRNVRSAVLIAKDWLANVRATEAVVVQGTVKPPCPSDAAPGIAAWTAAASAAGATMSVVPWRRKKG